MDSWFYCQYEFSARYFLILKALRNFVKYLPPASRRLSPPHRPYSDFGNIDARRSLRSAASIGLIAALCLAVLSIQGCSKPSKDKASRTNAAADAKSSDNAAHRVAEFLTPVSVRRIERGPMRVTVSATASVVPVRSETLQSMESGVVVFPRPWEEGDRATSGTLLASLDNEDLTKQYETAQADLELQRRNIEIQRIRLRQQERDYTIVQDLYARGLAPLRDVELAKLALENARNSLEQAGIARDKADLALRGLKRRFDFLEIRAPFDGMLVSRSTLGGRSNLSKTFGAEPLRVLEGRFIPKSTDLFGLVDTSSVHLKCDITSKDIAKIRVGQPATGVVYSREILDVEGRVVAVSPTVNPETRAFDVLVLVPNPDDHLLPGMFGRVEVVVQHLHDVIAIPKALIQRRGEEDVVFVIDRPSALPHPVARRATVELGVESRDRIEILHGLRHGDELVVRGYEILRDALPLQVSSDDEPTT